MIVAGSIELAPRSSSSLVVLWIVSDRVFFDHLTGLIEGTNYPCPDLQGYVCMVRCGTKFREDKYLSSMAGIFAWAIMW